MNLNQAQLLGLEKMISLNSGTLQHSGSGVINRATVYQSAYRDANWSVDNTGFQEDYDNLYVMAKTSDVSSWNLKPLKTEVTLDGVKYMTGKTITVNGPATTIWLRKRLL